MRRDAPSASDVRELGRKVEFRVLDALNGNGIWARHATPEEDLQAGFDLEIEVCGILVRVDLTISKSRLAEKQASDHCRNGHVVPVLVDPGWSAEELAKETVRQVLASLNGNLVKVLLEEITEEV